MISRRRKALYLLAEVPLQNRYRAMVTGEGEPVPSGEISAEPEPLKNTNGKRIPSCHLQDPQRVVQRVWCSDTQTGCTQSL